MAAVVAVAGLVPSARAQVLAPDAPYPPGTFTYQFTSTTGVPLVGPVSLAVNDFFSFKVYLLQTNAAVTPTIATVGVQGNGVRLTYNGAVARVPDVFDPENFIPNPQYDFTTVGGGPQSDPNSFDTSSEAYMTNGISNPTRRLPFPAAGDGLRILIGQFRIQGLSNGSTTIAAIDPFAGVNNQTGPDPPRLLNPAVPAAGFSTIGPGPHNIDPGLVPNSLVVNVGVVPEPSTLALGGLAAAGMAVIRRRRQTAAVAA